MRATIAIVAAATLLGASAHAQTDATSPDDADEVIETDATLEGEAMEIDGTQPVDASPGAADQDDATATDVTAGGDAAVTSEDAEIATDVRATPEGLQMDGTVPVDESPEPGADEHGNTGQTN